MPLPAFLKPLKGSLKEVTIDVSRTELRDHLVAYLLECIGSHAARSLVEARGSIRQSTKPLGDGWQMAPVQPRGPEVLLYDRNTYVLVPLDSRRRARVKCVEFDESVEVHAERSRHESHLCRNRQAAVALTHLLAH